MSGPFGWAGVAFAAAAFVSDMVGAAFMVLLVANRDGRFVLPLIVAFFFTFPLLGVASALWQIGSKRAGMPRPSTMSKERQRQVFGTLAVMNLGSLLGIGAFIYLAVRLEGNRRFVVSIVPILLACLVSYLALLKLREIQNRPAPRTRQHTIIFVGLSLGGSALLLIIGFFWIPS